MHSVGRPSSSSGSVTSGGDCGSTPKATWRRDLTVTCGALRDPGSGGTTNTPRLFWLRPSAPFRPVATGAHASLAESTESPRAASTLRSVRGGVLGAVRYRAVSGDRSDLPNRRGPWPLLIIWLTRVGSLVGLILFGRSAWLLYRELDALLEVDSLLGVVSGRLLGGTPGLVHASAAVLLCALTVLVFTTLSVGLPRWIGNHQTSAEATTEGRGSWSTRIPDAFRSPWIVVTIAVSVPVFAWWTQHLWWTICVSLGAGLTFVRRPDATHLARATWLIGVVSAGSFAGVEAMQDTPAFVLLLVLWSFLVVAWLIRFYAWSDESG